MNRCFFLHIKKMEPIEQPEPEGADPAKRGRGRPPGSKNKPKLTIEPIAQVVEPTPEPIVQVVEPIPEPLIPVAAPPKAKRAPRAPPAAPAAPAVAVVAEPDAPAPVAAIAEPAPIAPAPVESRKRPRVARVAESTIAQVPQPMQTPTLSPAEQYQMHMQAMTQLRLQERAARQNHFDRLVGLV